MYFDILTSVFRLPIKRRLLNPVELAWSDTEQYMRDNNTNFRLSDVKHLGKSWMLDLETATVTAYLGHVHTFQQTFKKCDAFTKQIQEELLDDDDNEEIDSEIERITD